MMFLKASKINLLFPPFPSAKTAAASLHLFRDAGQLEQTM
jgi:hypothetical protein